MKPFKIVLVDDEVNFLETLGLLVESEGFETEKYVTLEAAKRALQDREDLFIVLLDHDFKAAANEEQVGYELARWLKSNHWARHALPILYITGREVPLGYIRTRRELGGLAPDEFIGKEELASHPDLLPERLAYYETRLYNFEATVDERGKEMALLIYGGMDL